MKILALFLVLLAISSFAFSKKSLNKKLENSEGTNASSGEKTEAVTHGLASNNGYILQSTAVFYFSYQFRVSNLPNTLLVYLAALVRLKLPLTK
jgi:hypothetical protein